MENIKDRTKMRPDESFGGLIFPAGNGTRNTGFEELSVTHPYASAAVG